MHYKKGKRRLIVAGIITILVPFTGIGSLVAKDGIKELVIEGEVQRDLKAQLEAGDKEVEELLAKAKSGDVEVTEEPKNMEDNSTKEGA